MGLAQSTFFLNQPMEKKVEMKVKGGSSVPRTLKEIRSKYKRLKDGPNLCLPSEQGKEANL